MDVEQEEVVEPIDEVSEQQDAPTEDAPAAEPAPAPAPDEPVAEPIKGQEPAALSEEAQLAAEALAATEDQPAQPQQGVPVAVIAELRADRRADRQLIEALQAQLAERNKPAEPVVEPSPLEKWIAENPEDAEVTSAPAKVILAERKWQDRQATVRVEQQQVEQRKTVGQESYNRAKSTFTDFDTIVELGGQHLTPGNKLDIASSKDPAALLYKLCIKATLDSGTADAAVMRQHLQSKLAKGSPPTRKTEQPKPGPAAQPSAPRQPAVKIHNPRLAQVLATFDM